VDFVGMVIPGQPVGITTKAVPIQLIMAVRIPNNSLLAVVRRLASASRTRTIALLDDFLATLSARSMGGCGQPLSAWHNL
jgi:hypothetical protein